MTVLDRSVVIRMKRRAPSEPIARFRDRRARAEAAAITQPDWDAVTLVTDVTGVPDGLSDRAMDSWEPLAGPELQPLREETGDLSDCRADAASWHSISCRL